MKTIIKQETVRTLIPKDELVDVTYYITDDGKEFKNKYAAMKHDDVLATNAAKAKDISELLACPFCGCTNVYMSESLDDYYNDTTITVECQGADCDATISSRDKKPNVARAEAKRMWNKRTNKQ